MLQALENEINDTQATWINICERADLIPNSGICAILPPMKNMQKSDASPRAQEQLALFYLPVKKSVYVCSNWDPIGKANVMYRGLVGSIDNEPMVASPLYKQHYSLLSGICFEQADLVLKTYESRFQDNILQIKVASPIRAV